jgi:hypothetical protein
VEDHDLLAAIGQVVVDAAALEYFIAVLVAAIEGRDEEWARREPGPVARAARTASTAARVNSSRSGHMCP